MKKKILLFSSLLCSFSLYAQDLGQHRWQDRIILLFAEQEDDPVLQNQLDLLTQQSGEVTDRDLVIYQFFSNGESGVAEKKWNTSQSLAFFQKFNVQRDTFTFILVGKDGGEKLRSNAIVTLPALFALIDGMPMRRAEMRRKKGG